MLLITGIPQTRIPQHLALTSCDNAFGDGSFMKEQMTKDRYGNTPEKPCAVIYFENSSNRPLAPNIGVCQ